MAYKYEGDYDEVKAWELPSVGQHIVEIEEATEEMSSAGNQMMVLVCKVLDGVGKGSRLWEYIVYNEYADNRFGAILHACEQDSQSKRNISPANLVGLRGGVIIKHESWQGEKKAKIAYWKLLDMPYWLESVTEKITEIINENDIPF